MSITITKYIDIVSGVAGAATLARRHLGQRIFTTNILVPIDGIIEITELTEVGTYFGTDSEEYLRAVEYFGFVSKSITQNDMISYAGYSTTAVASRIIGNQQAQVLADLILITAGEITIDIGGDGGTTAAINLSGAASISDAMTLIETAIQATGAGAAVTACTVAYDPVGERVNLVAGATGVNAITISSTTVGFLDTLGWSTGSAISDGSDGETTVAALTTSDDSSDNFGSITFAETLTLEQHVANAQWNDALNVKYIYNIPVTANNSQAWYDDLQNIGGCQLTLIVADTDYTESIPSILLGATDYDNVNSTINYMYQIVNYPISVDDTTTSNTFDAIRVNYNGQTQSAGSEIFFYQRGFMMGTSSDPVDMNVYANEMWFKDAILVSLMNLLLAMEKIPANTSGSLTINSTIKGIVDEALANGTISVDKTLTDLQKASIKSLTGNDGAADQVQNAGFWLEVNIVQEVVNDVVENNAEYLLIYSKDDVVRKIEGRQILI